MMGHTPFPWRRGERPEIGNVVRGIDPADGTPQTVAVVHGYSAEELAANLQLIESIPAMQGTLKGWLAFFHGDTREDAALSRMLAETRAALSLATGGRNE